MQVLTINGVYYALCALFFMGLVWSGAGAYYLGTYLWEIRGPNADPVAIAITVFIAGSFLNYIWLEIIESKRNELLDAQRESSDE